MPLKFCLLKHEMVAILENTDRAPGMVLSCPGMSLRALECLRKLVGEGRAAVPYSGCIPQATHLLAVKHGLPRTELPSHMPQSVCSCADRANR